MGHGAERNTLRRTECACYVLLLGLLSAGPVQARDAVQSIRSWRLDAALRDVAAADIETVWAVGEHGVVWHTRDGGRHWEPQESGIACSLTAVQFFDPQHGFALGGFPRPRSPTTTGVVLHTDDGGRTWQRDRRAVLPGVERARFVSPTCGWVLGCRSPSFGANLFVTDDGARSWTPVAGVDSEHWQAGDFVDPASGALVGPVGRISLVAGRRIEPLGTELGSRAVRQVRIDASRSGWLVGDGGLALRTADAGRTWSPPAAPLPTEFDARAIASRGPRAWIVGSPGTRVWHTADGGRTWQPQATGQFVPLGAVTFADDEHGWAVGALGTIIGTEDGGRTWRRQRAGGRRAAVLGLFAGPDSLPLECFGRLAAAEGFLTAIEFVTHEDSTEAETTAGDDALRIGQALFGLGVSDVEQATAFPAPPAGLRLPARQWTDRWDRTGAGHGTERLVGHLVRQIRTWAPEIIVTHAASAADDDPAGSLVSQLVLQAAEQAADPTKFPEQIQRLGLDAWQVRKVFGALRGAKPGTVNLATAQLAPTLGCTLAELGDEARAVLDASDSGPASLGFQVLIDHVPQGAGAHDFMSGIPLPADSGARRPSGPLADRGDDVMRRIAAHRRNAQAILTRAETAGTDADRLVAEIDGLARGLDPNESAELIYRLARQYQRSGRWPLAIETMSLLATRHPEHPLAEPAVVWLLQTSASSEIGWQLHRGQHAVHTQSAPPPLDRAAEAPQLPIEQKKQLLGTAGERASAQRAIDLGRLLEQRYPAAFTEPRVQFPLTAARRKNDQVDDAGKFYLNFSRGRPRDAWWACADSQLWLADPHGICPKNLWHVAAATGRPRLDGQLDDELWEHAKPIELESSKPDDASWPTRVRATIDDEFLYLAIECGKAAGCRYAATKSPRPRDPVVDDRDRVVIHLDLDRDWVTAYRLVVDHRGWAAEDCCGDPTWSPQWFVAAADSEASWTIEAALPIEALGQRRPKPHEAWAVGVERIAPGAGFQSWSQPAGVSPIPEGFGLMLFE
jgi:photosystem II stability/assembly factor-like uncharacterized protein